MPSMSIFRTVFEDGTVAESSRIPSLISSFAVASRSTEPDPTSSGQPLRRSFSGIERSGSTLPHFALLYETTGAELHYRNGDWVLHIHCKTDVEADTAEREPPENGTVLGGGLGVNTLAPTSTGTFWTGDEFGHWRREYEKRRGSLQQHGTRWAHENIRSAGRKGNGRFKPVLHRISNELIAEARENGCSVTAFGELSDIRERTGASWGLKWAFDRLYEYVEYKAEEYGIDVQQVPRKARHGVAHTADSSVQTTAKARTSSV